MRNLDAFRNDLERSNNRYGIPYKMTIADYHTLNKMFTAVESKRKLSNPVYAFIGDAEEQMYEISFDDMTFRRINAVQTNKRFKIGSVRINELYRYKHEMKNYLKNFQE